MTLDANPRVPEASTNPVPPPAPAPAPVTGPAPETAEFKVGQIVKTAMNGLGVIVGTGTATRPVKRTNADGTVTTELKDLAGYITAHFAHVIDSPNTAEELGLEAL